jgi:hypothetical protein
MTALTKVLPTCRSPMLGVGKDGAGDVGAGCEVVTGVVGVGDELLSTV